MQDNNIIQEAIDCLKRLRKENAELEAENTRLKSCMQEIKEICKETCRKRCTNDCLGTKKHCGYGQILQLINKAESG